MHECVRQKEHVFSCKLQLTICFDLTVAKMRKNSFVAFSVDMSIEMNCDICRLSNGSVK